MPLFDTHAHLDDERLRDDLPAVLERAAAAGVSHTVCVATTAVDSANCLRIAGHFPAVGASVGTQPNNGAAAEPGDWAAVERHATGARVVAVGEPGLDRHWDTTPFAQQE